MKQFRLEGASGASAWLSKAHTFIGHIEHCVHGCHEHIAEYPQWADTLVRVDGHKAGHAQGFVHDSYAGIVDD
jgi:hypothetical protein